MKKGISLISLVITIVVIIILAGITIFSSIDTVDESQNLKKEVEFENVCTFVRAISTRAEADMIQLDLSNTTFVTTEQLENFYSPSGELTGEEQNRVYNLNQSRMADPASGYHFVKGKDIENDTIPGLEGISSLDKSFVTPNRVENDYIINFKYGVVIAKVEPNKTLIRGKVR